jgi:hypothetical protein
LMEAGTKQTKKGRARLISLGSASLLLLASFEPYARAIDITSVCNLQPQVAKLEAVDIEPKCTALVGNPNTMPLAESCRRCSTAIQRNKVQVKGTYAETCGQATSAEAAGTGAAETAKNADPNAQNGFLDGAGAMQSKAMESVGLKASSSATFAKAAEACAAEIKEVCTGSTPDVTAAANAAVANCSEMAASSHALSAAAGEGASTLGDMAKYALGGAALLGMGALAYSMLNKNSSGSSSYDPYAAARNNSGLYGTSPTPDSKNSTTDTVTTYTTSTTPGDTDLGTTKNSTSGQSGLLLTNGNGLNGQSAASNAGILEGVKPGSSGMGGKSGGGAGAYGNNPGGAVANGGFNGVAGNGMAGSGMGGSSGASSAGDFAVRGSGEGTGSGGATDSGTIDLAAGTGKGGAILGMKANGDIDELKGALGAGTDLKPFDETNGDRSPASEGSGVQKGEGLSLFQLIRMRYAELKKSGHI